MFSEGAFTSSQTRTHDLVATGMTSTLGDYERLDE